MVADPLGEQAIILRELPLPAAEAARRIEAARLPGVEDVVAAYDTVGIYFTGNCPATVDLLSALERSAEVREPRCHRIPVCYPMGPDLSDVAQRLGLSSQEVISLHAGREYACFAVGFCPGFAYLGALEVALAGIPRRAEPRTRVAAGSVAIAEGQTAVYPLERPGGWEILGMTPLVLVDEADDYFPIRAGDTVVFESIDSADFEALKGRRL